MPTCQSGGFSKYSESKAVPFSTAQEVLIQKNGKIQKFQPGIWQFEGEQKTV
jgi:hypothetical protein